MEKPDLSNFVLPNFVVSKRDIIKMQRYIELYLDAMLQQRVSKSTAQVDRATPKLTKKIEDLFSQNHLDPNEVSLKAVHGKLEEIKEHAYNVRIAFASEPSDEVIGRVADWFRREIDNTILLQVGVQPSIAAGCVLQTGPHRYDFSLRQQLLGSTAKFITIMTKMAAAEKVIPPQATVPVSEGAAQ